MAYHYAYMTRVAEVREPESYAKAAMEEEMHALAAMETWDLVAAVVKKTVQRWNWCQVVHRGELGTQEDQGS